MRYIVNGQKYDIPENMIDSFKADYPAAEALKLYSVGSDKYEIPVSAEKDFLASFPHALGANQVSKPNTPKIKYNQAKDPMLQGMDAANKESLKRAEAVSASLRDKPFYNTDAADYALDPNKDQPVLRQAPINTRTKEDDRKEWLSNRGGYKGDFFETPQESMDKAELTTLENKQKRDLAIRENTEQKQRNLDIAQGEYSINNDRLAELSQMRDRWNEAEAKEYADLLHKQAEIETNYPATALGMTKRQYLAYEAGKDLVKDNPLLSYGDALSSGFLQFVSSPVTLFAPGNALADYNTYGQEGVAAEGTTLGNMIRGTISSLPMNVSMMLNPAIGSALTFTDITSRNIKEYYDSGTLDANAVLSSAISGTAQTMIEFMTTNAQMSIYRNAYLNGGKEALTGAILQDAKDIVSNRFLTSVGTALKAAPLEAAEEVYQNVADKITRHIVNDEEMPNLRQWGKELALDFAGGLMGGVVLGGMGQGITIVRNNRVMNAIEQHAGNNEAVALLGEAIQSIKQGNIQEAKQMLAQSRKMNMEQPLNLPIKDMQRIEQGYALATDAIMKYDSGLVQGAIIENEEMRSDVLDKKREINELLRQQDAGDIDNDGELRLYELQSEVTIMESQIAKSMAEIQKDANLREFYRQISKARVMFRKASDLQQFAEGILPENISQFNKKERMLNKASGMKDKAESLAQTAIDMANLPTDEIPGVKRIVTELDINRGSIKPAKPNPKTEEPVNDNTNEARLPGSEQGQESPVISTGANQGASGEEGGAAKKARVPKPRKSKSVPVVKGDYYIIRKGKGKPIFAVVERQDDKWFYTTDKKRIKKEGRSSYKVDQRSWLEAKNKSDERSRASRKAYQTRMADKIIIREADLANMPHLQLMRGVTFDRGDSGFDDILIRGDGFTHTPLIKVTTGHKGENWDLIYESAPQGLSSAVMKAYDEADSSYIVEAARKELDNYMARKTATPFDEIMNDAEYFDYESATEEDASALANDLIEAYSEELTETWEADDISDEEMQRMMHDEDDVTETYNELIDFFEQKARENGVRFKLNSMTEAEKAQKLASETVSPKQADDALQILFRDKLSSAPEVAGDTTTYRFKDGRVVRLNHLTGVIDNKASGKFTSLGNVGAVIDLIDVANFGNRVLYHEYFHLAWFMFLNREQRGYLTGYYKRQSGLTDPIEIEEYMADRFAEYGRAYDKSTNNMIKRIWNTMLERINKLLRMLGVIPEQTGVAEMFRDIREGRIDNKQESNASDSRYKVSSEQAEAERQMEAVRKQYENTPQWMKAPNGLPTKLNERQWLQVRTPNFINWFGDWINDPKNASKVVDENGEPMVVYHGTPDIRFASSDEAVFKTPVESLLGKEDENRSYFFAKDKMTAKTYADDSRSTDYQNSIPGIVEAFLNVRIPLEIDRGYQTWHGTKDAVDRARENENDAVVIKNVSDKYNGNSRPIYTTTYAVFFPTQIKSATANIGTFDPQNPDIRYKLVSDAVNAKFNEDLEQYFQGALPATHAFDLGIPGAILKDAGLGIKQIRLFRKTIKAKIDDHSLYLMQLKNLPIAINDPIFVMRSITEPESVVVLTEITHPEGNILVAINTTGKHNEIVINKITSIYGKDGDKILRWLSNHADLFNYINKEKSLRWVSSLRGSNSPLLADAPKAIDKINSKVGLSSEKFSSVRYSLITEAEFEYYKDILNRNNKDADAIAEEMAESRGLDKSQTKEKLGRQINAAYREADKRYQDVLAASAIAGMGRYIETNKPAWTERSDLTFHLDEAEVSVFEKDLGITLEEAERLGGDRHSLYLGALRVFADGNRLLEERARINIDIENKAKIGIEDKALLEARDVLTGMIINTRLAYDNIKGNAGRILRHAREQKTRAIEDYSNLINDMLNEEGAVYEELAELRAQLAETEAMLAALESAFNQLSEIVDETIIKRNDELIQRAKNSASSASTKYSSVSVAEQKAALQTQIDETKRRIEGLNQKIQEKIDLIKRSESQRKEVEEFLAKVKPGSKTRINEIPAPQATYYDLLKSALYQSMLSSPMTHIRNIFGNVSNSIAENLVNFLTSPIGEGKAILEMIKSIPDAGKALGKGFILDPGNKFDPNTIQGFNRWSKLFTIVTRILSAEDAFFFTIADAGQKAHLAWQEHKRTGASYSSLLREPSKDMLIQAHYEAKRATFNHNPEGMVGIVISGIEKAFSIMENMGVMGKTVAFTLKSTVLPFTRVVGNVANFAIDWSPLGLMRAGMYASGVIDLYANRSTGKMDSQRGLWKDNDGNWIKSPYKNRDVQRQVIRSLVGTLAMGLLYALLRNNISGGGPRDKDRRAQLMATGWRPYSVRIGDRWIPYNDYLFSSVLAVIGDYNDYQQYKGPVTDTSEAFARLSWALMGAAGSFLDRSFLSGMGNLLQAVSRNDEQYLIRTLGNTIGNVANLNLIRFANDIWDDSVYKPETVTQYALVSMRPFSRLVDGQQIPFGVNHLTGQIIEKDPPLWKIAGSVIKDNQPILASGHDIKRSIKALNEAKVFVPAARPAEIRVDSGNFIKLRGRDLEAYYRFRGEAVGLMLADYSDIIIDLQKAGEYDELQDLVQKIGSKATKRAKSEIRNNYKLKASYQEYSKSREVNND